MERNPDFVEIDEFLGDDFLKFHPEDWAKRSHTPEEERLHYEKCDVYLAAMREAGLWVVGSLFWDYLPDAIVIIDEAQHKEFVERRSDLSWGQAKKVRSFLLGVVKDHPEIPVYADWAAVASGGINHHLIAAAPDRERHFGYDSGVSSAPTLARREAIAFSTMASTCA